MDPSYYLADQVHALAAEQLRSQLNAEYLRGLRAALEAVRCARMDSPDGDPPLPKPCDMECHDMCERAIERLLEGGEG